MAKKRRITLSIERDGWCAKVHGADPLYADSVAELSHAVRGVVGDRAWLWKLGLGEDTNWYVQLAHHYSEKLGNGLLSNDEARAHLVQAVWALRLGAALEEDCAEICGVPIGWVREIWDEASVAD